MRVRGVSAVRTAIARASRDSREIRGGRVLSRSAWGALLVDLNRVYRQHLTLRARDGAQVGRKTQRERRVVIERALRDLHRSGFELRRLKNLQGKHIRAIVEGWRQRGHKPSTLATNVSHLRTLCRWVDKPELLENLNRLIAAEPHLTRRTVATDRDRSERGAGIDRSDVLNRARNLDPRFACQLALVVAFGLRVQEAWLFRPHMAENSGAILILWGTKGGRPRTLPLPLTPEQSLALAWAKTFARSRADSMIPTGWTLERWRRRFYRLCRRIGLTKKLTGVTPHSFRHGVLLDLYEHLTASPAPARGGELELQDVAADRAARAIVAQHAGHARLSVSTAYLGPMGTSARDSNTATTDAGSGGSGQTPNDVRQSNSDKRG